MVRGLAVAPILEARDAVLQWRAHGQGGVGSVSLLDAELDTLMLAKAGNMGLPQEWIERLLAAGPARYESSRHLHASESWFHGVSSMV